MCDWLVDNREWLFSGILIVIPLSIVGWIIQSSSKSKSQKSGKNSINIQADGNININGKDNNDEC